MASAVDASGVGNYYIKDKEYTHKQTEASLHRKRNLMEGQISTKAQCHHMHVILYHSATAMIAA
jgi:hypothetical protein